MDLIEEVVMLRSAILQIGERLVKSPEGVAILEELGERDEEHCYLGYGNFETDRGWVFFGQFINGEEWLAEQAATLMQKLESEVIANA